MAYLDAHAQSNDWIGPGASSSRCARRYLARDAQADIHNNAVGIALGGVLEKSSVDAFAAAVAFTMMSSPGSFDLGSTGG